MTAAAPGSRLAVTLAGLPLQNPILLAAGTAGYGRELDGVIRLDRLGGIVTKAVSPEPRHGAPSPRVAEFPGGMLNAVGLANPGMEAVRDLHLPWLASQLHAARLVVNVVGREVEDFARVVAHLDPGQGHDAYELNVSCPNVRAGGMEFGSDPRTLRDVVSRARANTGRPIFVKLSPTLADIAAAADVALSAGANGLALVNTMPGLLVDVEHRRPMLGFGTGGISGAALLPIGVLATWRVHKATGAPIIGVGGVARAEDAVQYILAGASAVAVGTAVLRDPRTAERIVSDLAAWCEVRGITSIAELTGALEWPE